MKKRFGMLLLDGGLLVGAVAAKFLAVGMIELLPDCIFDRVGITCPSCGGTRCVREFLSGHFREAFFFHPFVFGLICYLAAALVALNVGYLLPQRHCQRLGKAMVSGKAIVILSILYAVFGIVRMFLTLPA